MMMKRRTVLQVAAGGAALASLVPAAVHAANAVRPTDFAGAGLYLYPDWGQPRAYLVVPTGPGQSVLEFRDPATTALCWTQSLALTGRFAAKLV